MAYPPPTKGFSQPNPEVAMLFISKNKHKNSLSPCRVSNSRAQGQFFSQNVFSIAWATWSKTS